MKLWLFLLLVSVACALAVPAERANAIRVASLRKGVCTLHHVRLRTATAYEFAPLKLATFDPSASAIHLYTQYPNCIPTDVSFTKGEDFRKPIQVRYCPVCQRIFDKNVKPD